MSNITKTVGRVKRGDKKISARLLNDLSRNSNKTNNLVSNPKQSQKTPKTQPFVRFEVVSEDGDFILAKRVYSDGSLESTSTKIAKPYLLQRTPFDGETRDSIDYTYSSDNERQADDSVDTEDQVIVPNYVAGDRIYAFKPSNGTGVEDDSSDPVIWQEMEGSRAWAKVSPT